RDRCLDPNRSALASTATDIRFHVQDLNAERLLRLIHPFFYRAWHIRALNRWCSVEREQTAHSKSSCSARQTISIRLPVNVADVSTDTSNEATPATAAST